MEKKLKRVITNPFFQLILTILSITGINGLVIIQNIGDLRLIIEITLGIGIMSLLLYVWRLKIRTKVKKKEPVLYRIGPSFLINGASKLFRIEKDKLLFGPIEDKVLKINKITCNYKLSFTETGNMQVKRRYQGVNLDPQPVLYINAFAGGDHSISDKSLKENLKAYDGDRNDLSIELIKDFTTGTVKPFRIYFGTPIKEGQSFDVTIEYYWPACISRNPDGLLFWNTYFTRGVDELDITIASPIKFKNCRIDKLVLNNGDVKKKRDYSQPCLNPDRSSETGPYVYNVKISKPIGNYFFEFEY